MRLHSVVGSLGIPLLLGVLGVAACTAQGSSTTVTGPGSTSGAPVFPMVSDEGGAASPEGGGPTTTDYDALFGPPSSTVATPNSIIGWWAGSDASTADIRLVLTASKVVIAKHCSSGGSMATGVEIVSQVTSGLIRTLESKAAPGAAALTCGLQFKPTEVKRCLASADIDAQTEGTNSVDGCFFLGDTKLNFYGGTFLEGARFSKLSDTTN